MIDLRPLRLRPTFDMRRLRREVEIMQHIDHENIVKLQEVGLLYHTSRFHTPVSLIHPVSC